MLLRGVLLCCVGIALMSLLWFLSPTATEQEAGGVAAAQEDAATSSEEPDLLVIQHVPADREAANEIDLRDSYCLWPDDTLGGIALDAGVTVEAILAENPDFTGYAGSAIFLPAGSTPPHLWSSPAPVVPTIDELPFGVSGYYISYDNRQKRVALSFDIGYVPENHDLMRELAEQGIRATFLVMGNPVSRYPEIIDHILDNGHELGNHSFTHDNMLSHSVADIGSELRLTEKVVREARANATTKPLFRAPFGAINNDIIRIANAEGYQVVGWTIDSRDWTEDITANAIYAQVTENVCPGAIIALHDVNPASAIAIPRIIDYLRRNGYSFATVSEMIFPPGT